MEDSYSQLTDLNTGTYIDSDMALSALGHLKIDLIIPKKINNELVTVYFNQTVIICMIGDEHMETPMVVVRDFSRPVTW